MQTEQPLDQKSISLNQFLNLFDQFKSLIWVDSLEVRFEVGGGGKFPLCLKLVRIMLETWDLVRNYTQICRFRKYTF